MRWAIAGFTLALLFGASVYFQGNQIAPSNRDSLVVEQPKEVPPEVEDFMGNTPKQVIFIEPDTTTPMLCAEERSAPTVTQVGCGAKRSRPEKMALRRSWSRFSN
jgi:hypothetical protein